MGKYFGTDGIRGIANRDITPLTALKLGQAAGCILTREKYDRPVVLIGRDTRISGDMIESALTAGLTSTGCDVLLGGVIPTPGVPFLARSLKLDYSMVITASHNPMEDNGIKCFTSQGYKLLSHQEEEMETLMDQGLPDDFDAPVAEKIGKIMPLPDPLERYRLFVQNLAPERLDGLSVALDCANGSTHRVALEILSNLGARVVAINTHPTGTNINYRCGATNPELLQTLMKGGGFDAGFAFDGDGDRVIAIDEMGQILDGDHILNMFALFGQQRGLLNTKTVVATVMSNLGLEKSLSRAGIRLLRSDVGDKNVVKMMVEENAVLGGEKSGHIIFLEDSTTGDGIITALHILTLLKQSRRCLSSFRGEMTLYPQVLRNVKVKDKQAVMDSEKFNDYIRDITREMGESFRILVRPSGTESLIRVMAEGPDSKDTNDVVEKICRFIESLNS